MANSHKKHSRPSKQGRQRTSCNTSKGQAALEYFTTYGWAILVLVVVVAILLSSGMLNTSYLISEECNFGTNLPCKFALYNEGETTHMSVQVFNGFAYKIVMRAVELKTDDGRAFVWLGSPPPFEVESGAQATLTGELAGAPVPEGVGKRFSGTIIYSSCAPEIDPNECSTSVHQITGTIYGKAIPQ